MKSETFTMKSKKGATLFGYKWSPDGEPSAIVLISHGMVETAERYGRLAEKLTLSGYIVYAIDHLGHGRTAKSVEDIGVLYKDDFAKMVDTLEDLRALAQKAYPGKKTFLLGHSMGSFLAQSYSELYGAHIDGVILSGTSGKTPGLFGLNLFVKLLTLIRGVDTKAKLLDMIQFGGYNKHFKPTRTPFDWLSRDEKEVDKYIENPYCGIVVTYGFFQCLLKGTMEIHKPEAMKKIPTKLPIYIFVGTMDPVGSFTKTVKWLIDAYKAIGIQDVTHKFYPEGRHEMLNEINRDEVMQDVVDWLNAHR